VTVIIKYKLYIEVVNIVCVRVHVSIVYVRVSSMVGVIKNNPNTWKQETKTVDLQYDLNKVKEPVLGFWFWF